MGLDTGAVVVAVGVGYLPAGQRALHIQSHVAPLPAPHLPAFPMVVRRPAPHPVVAGNVHLRDEAAEGQAREALRVRARAHVVAIASCRRPPTHRVAALGPRSQQG